MTTALEGGEASASRPGRSLSLSGKTRHPLYRRLGGPQGWSGQVRKISPPPGFDPQIVQPLASCYIYWATWPTNGYVEHSKLNLNIWCHHILFCPAWSVVLLFIGPFSFMSFFVDSYRSYVVMFIILSLFTYFKDENISCLWGDNLTFIMWSFTMWLKIFWFSYQLTFCWCCIMNLVLSFRCFQCGICIEFSYETGNQLRSKNNFVNGTQKICKPCLLKTVQYCTLLVTFYTCYKYPVGLLWWWVLLECCSELALGCKSHIGQHAVPEVMATRGMSVLE